MKKRLFVDIHGLQTVPPSCINRDDTGAPKTCIYGGVTRSRVSSQAWKKAMRDAFRDLLPEDELGFRTKKIVGLVKDEILKIDSSLKPEKAEKLAEKALTDAGLKIKNAKQGTDALFFMGKKQAEEVARCAVEGKSKDDLKKALKDYPTVDMALFGRMVAADPSLNYDAAAQVAHAISTHAVPTEFDYFTAVDDLGDEDSAGAGHIGVNEFNSSTLYRYATVNVQELNQNLGNIAPEAVRAFLKAFICSMPTGKQNSYANNTLPTNIYVAVREDQPVSLAGAFEEAVKASEHGYEAESQRQLVKKAEDIYSGMAPAPAASFTIGRGLEKLAEPIQIEEALDRVEELLREKLAGGED